MFYDVTHPQLGPCEISLLIHLLVDRLNESILEHLLAIDLLLDRAAANEPIGDNILFLSNAAG